jgi:magnesium chelatase family protein
LEQGEVWVTRAAGNARFPADFTLIAAHNPCPCGFRGAKMPGKVCRCRSVELDRYYRRLSGPILDRIDLHVWIDSLRPEQLAQVGQGRGQGKRRESSKEVGRRVRRARKRQSRRYRGLDYQTNSDVPASDINEHCRLEPPARRLLNRAMVVSGLSNRAYHRVMKVARTIADLEGAESIQPAHVAEALSFRWEGNREFV